MLSLFAWQAGPVPEVVRAFQDWTPLVIRVGLVIAGVLFVCWLTLRYIPNNKVGVVEKLFVPLMPRKQYNSREQREKRIRKENERRELLLYHTGGWSEDVRCCKGQS